MKAFTCWQPYASLLMQGIQKAESRDWCPPYDLVGKRIAIHAGTHKIPESVWTRYEPREKAHREIIDRLGFGPDDVPYGAVLGTARLQQVRRVLSLYVNNNRENIAVTEPIRVVASMPQSFVFNQEIECDGFASYYHGRFLWFLDELEEFDQPIPQRGFQKFWEWHQEQIPS